MKRIVRTFGGILAAVTIGMMPTVAAAQDKYPSKIVIDNKPGANTTIGANAVLKAAPDGYTLFYGGVMGASPIFVKNGAVDFVTQMKPVSLVLSAPLYLLVNSSKVPATTMQDLIAYSKKNQGGLNYADGAPLSTMVMQAIAERTGLMFTPVPYKGSAPSLTALIGGEIDMALDTVPNYMQYIKSGKVRALMSTGPKRMANLPDVPAAPEVKGIDFTAASVLSMWAPPGTPDAIIQRLNTEIVAIAKDPEFREAFLKATQVEPVASTPAELQKAIEADKALYSGIAKKMGYQPQ